MSAMQPLVVDLGAFAATDQALCGPRASSLARLHRAGLRVAPGLVLTRLAFQAHCAGHPAAAAARHRLECAAPGKAEAALVDLRAVMAAAPLEPETAMALRPRLAALLQEGPVILRPSGSWPRTAGEADLALNVARGGLRSVEAVLAELPTLFAAIAAPAALGQWQGGRRPEMAILIQSQLPLALEGQVEPFAAGQPDKPLTVQFEDPHSGRASTLLMAADTGRILAGETRLPFCLPASQAALLARMHERACQQLGFPQSLRFGVAQGELAVLDARPVTRLARRWRRAPMAERFPTPLSPLTWDLLGDGYEQAFHLAAQSLGLPPISGDWLSCVDGRVRVDQTLLDLCLAPLEPEWRDLAELQRLLPRLDARHRWLHELPTLWLGDLDRYLLRLGQLGTRPVEGMAPRELWRRLSDLRALGLDFFRHHGRVELAGIALSRLLSRVVHSLAGEALGVALLEDLLRPIGGREALLRAELAELRRLAGADLTLLDWLRRPDRASAWAEGPPAEQGEFAARLADIVSEHGHLAARYDLSEPTWAEEPWRLLESLGPAPSPNVAGAGGEAAPTEAALRLRQAQAEARFMAMVPAGLGAACRELLRLTRLYRGLPAQERYQVRRLAAPLRAVLLEMGRRMRDEGRLGSAEEVFTLRLAAIAEWATGHGADEATMPVSVNLGLPAIR